MIDTTLGLPALALRNMEVYASATLQATICPTSPPKAEWRETMDAVANVATRAYRSVVREHADFVPFFRAATPEQELGLLKIGSRPARRKSGGGLESLRAIPWIFAWTQTRLLLPSWLGVGEGLVYLKDHVDDDTRRQMVDEWPFFRSMLALIEMVLAKADPEVAALYFDRLVEPKLAPLGQELLERHRVTVDIVMAVLERSELLADNGELGRSIRLRNPYVDPLNILQAELLARLRDAKLDSVDAIEIEEALLTTMQGVAAGMRNTG
jgi:phosphoenolpyruvate carboxylase